MFEYEVTFQVDTEIQAIIIKCNNTLEAEARILDHFPLAKIKKTKIIYRNNIIHVDFVSRKRIKAA